MSTNKMPLTKIFFWNFSVTLTKDYLIMKHVAMFALPTWAVVSVHNAEGEERTVAVGTKWHLDEGRQVVHEVKLRSAFRVTPGHQHVNLVWRLREIIKYKYTYQVLSQALHKTWQLIHRYIMHTY